MDSPSSIKEKEIHALLDKSKIVYQKIGKKITVAHATLPNGFEVVSYSGVNDPMDYDKEIGSKIAYQKLVDKLWELEAYHRHC